ncbi:hypothetical protein COL91_02165 [Bacillus pseudomycoides]|nr:hypothetical protein COO02_07625 [Bacillus pseudomycoides]PGA94436.1 hypothetical protein COL91_02165 [Bacillus pseudomycoides]
MKEFYVNQISRKQIGFPDVYFHLSINETELRKRKEHDITRRRSNFEKHLSLIEPQKQYFQYMNTISPNLVHFIDAVSIEANIKSIFEIVSNLNKEKHNNDSVTLFENVMDWLMNSDPKAY